MTSTLDIISNHHPKTFSTLSRCGQRDGFLIQGKNGEFNILRTYINTNKNRKPTYHIVKFETPKNQIIQK